MANELTTKTAGGLKEYFGKPEVIESIASTCVAKISPERLVRLALLAAQDDKLSKCTPQSWHKALLDCAKFGVEPMMGRLYLIAYGTEVQTQLGYLGLLEIVRRNVDLKNIFAEVVYEGDTFEVEYGTTEKFRHVPNFEVARENEYKLVYAYAKFASNEFRVITMSKSEVENIRKIAKQKNRGVESPAWANYPIEMSKKVVLKRLCKTLPMSFESLEAIQTLDEGDNVPDITVTDETPKVTSKSRLADVLAKKEVSSIPPEPLEPDGLLLEAEFDV
jgi:recombination protein RecT